MAGDVALHMPLGYAGQTEVLLSARLHEEDLVDDQNMWVVEDNDRVRFSY